MEIDSSDMSPEDYSNYCNLIVNYVPTTLTEEEFRGVFEQYGELESAKLMVDKMTKQSLGYGFVKYTTPENALKAINELNGKSLQSKTLKVAYAKPPIQYKNLYVSQMDPSITKEDLDALFSPYGKIVESRILTDKATQASKGVGFVHYETRAQAEAAANALNGTLLPNMSQPLRVKFANVMSEKKNTRKTPGNFTNNNNTNNTNGRRKVNNLNNNNAGGNAGKQAKTFKKKTSAMMR